MWAGHRAREKGERAYHLPGDCRRGLFSPAGRCGWWREETPPPLPCFHPQPLSPRLSAAPTTHVHTQWKPCPSSTQPGVWLKAADLCPPKPWKPAQQVHHWPLCSCAPLTVPYIHTRTREHTTFSYTEGLPSVFSTSLLCGLSEGPWRLTVSSCTDWLELQRPILNLHVTFKICH